MDARYESIINMEQPEPGPRHPRMSVQKRAAQFSPYAALSGYGDIVSATADKVVREAMPEKTTQQWPGEAIPEKTTQQWPGEAIPGKQAQDEAEDQLW